MGLSRGQSTDMEQSRVMLDNILTFTIAVSGLHLGKYWERFTAT